MWSVRQPKKDSVETLIKSLDRFLTEVHHKEVAATNSQPQECQPQPRIQRVVEDVSFNELTEGLESARADKERYQKQFQLEVSRSRDMRIALESKGRENQKLRHLLENIPKRPPTSHSNNRLSRPQSAGINRPQSAGVTRPKSAGMMRSSHF